jgi:ComF family protein
MNKLILWSKVMQLLTVFSDALFPPNKNLLLIRKIDRTNISDLFTPNKHLSHHYLTSYQDETVRALITENKFQNNQLSAKWLAHLLDIWLDKQTTPLIIVPIPLGRKRLRQRGYNQVTNIVRVSRYKNNLNETLLVRTKETSPQSTLDRSDRLQNVANAFACNKFLSTAPETTLVLLDDVITTGSTLAVAKRTLTQQLPADIKIISVAIAH